MDNTSIKELENFKKNSNKKSSSNSIHDKNNLNKFLYGIGFYVLISAILVYLLMIL